MPTEILKAEEFQTKVPVVTIAVLVTMTVLGFFFGMNFSKMQAQDEMQKVQHQFALDEISGLRNDMNREVQLIRVQLDKLNGKPND